MTATEPDTFVVLGCIALGLVALVFSGVLLGWALCRRRIFRKAERITIIDRAGQHREALVLEERQC